MKTKTILKRIADTSPAFRVLLAKQIQKHSEAQCNGDYYFDDDRNEWIGYTGAPLFQHSADNAQAFVGRREEKDIVKKILSMTGTKEIPSFMGYNGDPRGFVIKIFSDKLTPDEIDYCRNVCNFMMDWGSDFTIIKNGEI